MRSPGAIAALLFVGVVSLYLPTLNSNFVNYDDPAYVTKNARVLQGLSLPNVNWACRTTMEANWHPVTWISHMADVQMFGANPRGAHAVNVFFHGLNVVLLFFVLHKATKNLPRSALVAALFAFHPLNVECVAWVAERKSLLSMFFCLLALAFYQWYVAERRIGRYLLVVTGFAVGLAAKPMIVTLPILLLVWDYWPLARYSSESEMSVRRPRASELIGEKIPLFALSAASSLITLYVQRASGALGRTDVLPFAWRIKNAVYSCVAYVAKGLWPTGLAVFYPHPEGSLALWKVFAAGVLVAVGSALAYAYRKEHRYLLAGWLWYLVAMVPMIGLVQAGRQGMADRYAYLPFLGLFIIAVWGCADLFAYLNVSRLASRAIAATALVLYASMAWLQISYWHDSYTLFSHAIAVTQRNGIAEGNLGAALVEMGRPDLAMPHFEAAVGFVPQLATAHYNLGVLQQQQQHLDLARQEYELSLKYSSDTIEVAQAHSNLGFLLMELNDLKGASQEFTSALQVNPNKQNSLLGRGMIEYRQGNLDAAVSDLSRASQIGPLPLADFWLGRSFEAKGEAQAAIKAYEAALQLNPSMAEAQQRLDILRVRQ
jgi:tetratricopeptide (TPR) repeat protein